MTDSVHGDVDRVVAALGGTKFPYHTFGRFRLRRRWTVAPAARAADPTPRVEATPTAALSSAEPPAVPVATPLWQEAMSWPEPLALPQVAPQSTPAPAEPTQAGLRPELPPIAAVVEAIAEAVAPIERIERIDPIDPIGPITLPPVPPEAPSAPAETLAVAPAEPSAVDAPIIEPPAAEASIVEAPAVAPAIVEPPAIEVSPLRPRPPLLTIAALPGLWDDLSEPALLADAVPPPRATSVPSRGPDLRANIFQLAWKNAAAAEAAAAAPAIPTLGAPEVALPGESELFRRI